VVLERRRDLLERTRQRDPQLQAVQARPRLALGGRRALGVHNPTTGGHPVDGARSDGLLRAQAVAVEDLAFEQVRHRRQVDVRVWPHVHAGPGRQPDRPHVVEEDERADHPPRRRREQPPHDQPPAEVTLAGGDLQIHRQRRTVVRRA
jgi:hypothetical protein